MALDDALPAGVEPQPGAWSRAADTLLRTGQAQAYRAAVTVLAQDDQGLAPTIKHRGGRVVELRELTAQSMARWAADMAEHLLGRRYEGLEPYGLRGTLDPLTGGFVTPTDDPFAQGACGVCAAAFRRQPLGAGS
ncbi:MAG: hypothetical protein KatS3mg103_0646 [Phycisphaerales bacterium]|nr:MAG: hypothetical protein KatS3mg103_0646 [Phycisphaerales bacterium]